jgi:hypothetical protein
MFSGILPKPVFNIKLLDSLEKGSSQKSARKTIEKLIVSKNMVLAHVHNMLDEVIEIIYNISSTNKSMRKCKKSLALFNVTKIIVPNEHAESFNIKPTVEPYFIDDTSSLQNSVLKLIQNLQLGDYKNVHKAKCRLMTGNMLPANFSCHDLIHVIKNIEFKTQALLHVKKVTLTNLRELLNDPLEQLEKMPCNAEELDAIHIVVDDEFEKFIYDPIIHQKQHPEAPSWCVDFVDLLQYAFQFKE